MIEEVTASNDTLLFIDELHTLVGAGAAEGAIDAANLLKPALARGELSCIGATTVSEYRRYIEKDAALERRFQVARGSRPVLHWAGGETGRSGAATAGLNTRPPIHCSLSLNAPA